VYIEMAGGGEMSLRMCRKGNAKRTNWLHIEISVALSKGFPSNRDFDWMKVKKREKLSLSL
jgi:hypothetical protein